MALQMHPLEPAWVRTPEDRPLPSNARFAPTLTLLSTPCWAASAPSALDLQWPKQQQFPPMTPLGLELPMTTLGLPRTPLGRPAPPPGLALPLSGLCCQPSKLMPFRPPPGLASPSPEEKAAAALRAAGGKAEEAASSRSSETCSTADPEEELVSPLCLALSFQKEGLEVALHSLVDQSIPPPQLFPPPPPQVVCPLGGLSVGSATHHLGLCRPCDFIGRGFECRSGADCQFCHLCSSSERKQRKVQRKKLIQTLARVQHF